MIDVGLIGFGFAGRTFHAPVISAVDGLRLAAILERHGSEAEQRYPTAGVVRSLDELLAITSVQLIVVATSNKTKELQGDTTVDIRVLVLDTRDSAGCRNRLVEEKVCSTQVRSGVRGGRKVSHFRCNKIGA